MTEEAGCALLKSRFEKAGYTIAERYKLAIGGTEIELDGFDPVGRIGYEYITTEAGDRSEITPAVMAALEAAMLRDELYVLLIDEIDAPDERLLTLAADRFLAAAGARRARK
jgi:hypothetical protein